MDPDANLDELRAAATKYEQAESNDQEHEVAIEIIDLVRALDAWLSKGGFLPRDWVAKR